MYHAKVRDPVFFRIGTCGGIGYEGGSVVISEEAVDGALKNCQGRLDGAFCDFTEADKMEYLEGIHKSGVVNIEMESLAFAALTHHAGIKAAVICVTLLDRLKGDQVGRTSQARGRQH
ncbi:Uridine phosphorylase 1 [Operophtera brumata]|uniref:Uridine phosphorylase 1 n=1 Tax=Operophtera brumata TaxID=104452 RepID=A0A0L7L7C0_OPEBR|nr:Uridine phosphorylase 1 [Operophtera brumata]